VSQVDIAYGQPRACRLKINFPVWRGLHRGDQRLAGEIAFQSPELVGRDHHYLLATVHRYVLRPFGSDAPH